MARRQIDSAPEIIFDIPRDARGGGNHRRLPGVSERDQRMIE